MKVYCALECCRHHTVSSDEVGFVDFPSSAAELRRWLALTWVRHVVRGVTRLCTEHFLPDQLLADPEWERNFPGQVNPNPRVPPGVLPTLGVPGWLDDSELELESESEWAAAPSMFIRQEGSSARRVRPTARLREAHADLFDDLPPAPVVRRSRGRPPKGRRGRPPLARRPPSPPPDLSDPEVRARLVQQALDEYDWRQARAIETGVVLAADGTETLYISPPNSDDESAADGLVRRRGGSAVRTRRGRGAKSRRGAHGAAGHWPAEEQRGPPLAERLPPNTSQRFNEVLAAQREVQALVKQLEATPAPAADPCHPAGDEGGVALSGVSEDGSLMVLRGGESLATGHLPPEGDNYSSPTSLEVALGLLHQQRLENLRLRADLLRAAIRERQRSAQLADARQQAAEASKLFQDRLGDMFTPAQMKLIQNRSLRRTHMWDEVDVKRAIGLRRLCTRRAYTYVKDVLRVPLPGLAVLRGSSQRNPETALMYAQMVESHRQKHMTKRSRLGRPVKTASGSPEPPPTATPLAAASEGHIDHKYILLTTGKDGEAGDTRLAGSADAGAPLLVDESGAPLLVDRATGQSPPPAGAEQFFMLVPGDQDGLDDRAMVLESPPHRPAILGSSSNGREPAAAGLYRPRFRLVVKRDGEVTTEDGRPLEEISWPTGLHWIDAV